MKKFASYILLAAMMLSILTGCGGGQANKSEQEGATKTGTIEFTISTDGAIRSTYVDRFVELVEEASGGKYKGNVYAQSSIGSAADMAQMIQMGTLDFCLNDDMSIDGILDGALGFAWLPGLVADYEEADKYYNHGWIGEQVANIMEQNNMIRISSFCNGFRQVGNLKHEITEMSDLRGLKIRTPAVPSVVSFYEKCGAMPVMIATPEVLSALQTGTVDGLDNCIFNYVVQGLTDVITYITELNYCYSGGCFISSPTFWNKLSADQQQIVSDAAKASADYDRELNEQQTNDLVSALEEKGMKINSPELAPFAAATEKVLTDNADTYGDLLDQLKAWKEAR